MDSCVARPVSSPNISDHIPASATKALERGRVWFIGWLFCLCSALASSQFCFSIQYAVATPLFHNQLRLDQSTVALIMAIAGQVLGILVQPIVGAWSDGVRCSWGRRRPFVAVGAVVCAAGMGIMAVAVDLGKALGDDPDAENPGGHAAAITIAISGLVIMNVFVNVMMGPARAAIADLVPSSEQHAGNAMASGAMGIAAIVANLAGAQLFHTDAPYRNMLAMGVGLILLFVVPTLLVSKDVIAEKQEMRPKVTPWSVLVRVGRAVRNMPMKLALISIVFFLGWCAYTPLLTYTTDFFGGQIYLGKDHTDDSSVDPYQDGVQMGMYGLAVHAFVQWLFSFAVSPLVSRFGPAWTFAATQLVATIAYAAYLPVGKSDLSLTETVVVTFVLMGGIAVNFTSINSIPFGLARGITAGKDTGIYMGLLNSLSVFAQMITNLIMGAIIGGAPHDAPYHSENVAYGFVFGAALSALATALAVFLFPRHHEVPEKGALKQPLLVNAFDEEKAASHS